MAIAVAKFDFLKIGNISLCRTIIDKFHAENEKDLPLDSDLPKIAGGQKVEIPRKQLWISILKSQDEFENTSRSIMEKYLNIYLKKLPLHTGEIVENIY